MKGRRTVLVCVTTQESSKQLVSAGKAVAEKSGASLEVVSVLPMEYNEKKTNPKTIEALYQCAKEAGGEMAIYFSDDPILTVAAHIGKKKPETLVVGFPKEDSNDFVSMIRLLLPELPISMVDGDKLYNMLPLEAVSLR